MIVQLSGGDILILHGRQRILLLVHSFSLCDDNLSWCGDLELTLDIGFTCTNPQLVDRINWVLPARAFCTDRDRLELRCRARGAGGRGRTTADARGLSQLSSMPFRANARKKLLGSSEITSPHRIAATCLSLPSSSAATRLTRPVIMRSCNGRSMMLRGNANWRASPAAGIVAPVRQTRSFRA